jgi:Domain of unknown function (DUF932)
LHCGGAIATREQVAQAMTPPATDTWFPIPHAQLISQVETALGALHLRIVEEAHALARDGQRYFGLMRVANGVQASKDFGYVLGLRNSQDKAFTAQLCVGSSVFVCDNLAFSSEISLARKHTKNILIDLPRLTGQALGLLSQRWTNQAERFEKYKACELGNPSVHDIVCRAVELNACAWSHIPEVLKEWKAPRHPEFVESGPSAWRLFNAFTESLKASSLPQLPGRTVRLHALFDQVSAYRAPVVEIDAEVSADVADAPAPAPAPAPAVALPAGWTNVQV